MKESWVQATDIDGEKIFKPHHCYILWEMAGLDELLRNQEVFCE